MPIIDLAEHRRRRHEQHYVQVQESWAQTISAGVSLFLAAFVCLWCVWVVQ